MYYSESTRGFYDAVIHGDGMPADAVRISDELYSSLMNAQCTGKLISPDVSGMPVVVEPPPLTPEQVLTNNISIRDDLLRDAALIISPLQDAVDMNVASEVEQVSLLSWKRYRVALIRLDLSAATIDWPALPA